MLDKKRETEYCANQKCGELIDRHCNGEITIDDDNNYFCGKECAEKYYGIRYVD